MGWLAQRAPFQCSANVSSKAREEISRLPAAVQDAAEVQATPSRRVSFRCGLGVGCTAHRRPSQRSARVADGTLPRSPTAVHASRAVHDTAASSLPCPWKTGLGTGWADQLPPSQCSASGTPDLPAVVNCQPTAVQLAAEAQLTPASVPEPGTGTAGGLGAGTMTHLAPSHRSASSPLGPPVPTAMQAATAVHETPARRYSADPGLGAGSRDHLLPSHRSAKAAGPGFPLVRS